MSAPAVQGLPWSVLRLHRTAPLLWGAALLATVGLVGDWYSSGTFVSTRPAAVAHVLAGLALGALAGLVIGKALPAAGVAFVAMLALYDVLDQYRPSLRPADTVTGRAALNQLLRRRTP
ncbi:hypothetical protein AB0D27_29370 [Streptomyces sp. NPDC048415]|uniref:hypothetical protein n=1 Tax=Streptomyces sp. NPDC048415 TaxID=3154822 RepID=UPI0034460AE1